MPCPACGHAYLAHDITGGGDNLNCPLGQAIAADNLRRNVPKYTGRSA